MCLMPDMDRDYQTYNPDGTQREEKERYIDLSEGGGLGGGGVARRARNPEALKRYNEIKDDPKLLAEQKAINMRVAGSHRLEKDYGRQVHGRPTYRHVEEEREYGVDESTGKRKGLQDTNRKKKALEVKKEKRGQKKFTSMGAETIPNTPSTGINTP